MFIAPDHPVIGRVHESDGQDDVKRNAPGGVVDLLIGR
jgi:hypothetical protein